MNNIVLAIEDNEQNLFLLECLLEAHGIPMHGVRDGWSGIEMARRLKPAAILLDIQLPEMDGYEVAARLRQIKELDGTPIIAVTSYAMVGDRERILASGATDYIEKPINPETFITQLRKHLKF